MLSPVLDFQDRFLPCVTQVPMPINFPLVNFRAVKFSPKGEDQNSEAAAFIAALKTQPLSGFMKQPFGWGHNHRSGALFHKVVQDDRGYLIETKPLTFLQQLQTAVKSPQTPTLSPTEQESIERFRRVVWQRRAMAAEA